jgi:uncharacterized protein YdaL
VRLIPRVAFVALLLAAVWCVPATALASTIIYYDRVAGVDENVILANMMLNLAGHFDEPLDTVPVNDYRAEDMAAFDYVFYLGTHYHELPAAFLDDVMAGDRPVFWMAGNAEQLFARPGAVEQFGFNVADYNDGSGCNRIDYKSRRMERQGDLGFYETEVVGAPHIWATVSPAAQPAHTFPYCLSRASLFYLADVPFYYQYYDDRYLVLADLLHEFYETGVRPRKWALLRFEDLAPGVADVAVLRPLGEQLLAAGVRFSFSVTPIYMDPLGLYHPPNTVFRFEDDPEFVTLVNEWIAAGHTLNMHGVTHQRGNTISLYGYEFVLDDGMTPLACDSASWARWHVQQGLNEFRKQGWAPLVWETPHYAASHGDYHVFGESFAYYYDRPFVFPLPPDAAPVFETALRPASQVIPYYVAHSALGMGLIPETLNYIDAATPGQSPAEILDKAQRLTIVRDGVASFFYHAGYIPADQLREVVDGLLERDYTFVGLADLIPGFGDDDDDTSDDDDDNDDNDDDDSGPPAGDDDADNHADEGCGC